jgi:hypothetical protein
MTSKGGGVETFGIEGGGCGVFADDFLGVAFLVVDFLGVAFLVVDFLGFAFLGVAAFLDGFVLTAIRDFLVEEFWIASVDWSVAAGAWSGIIR